MVSNRLIDNLKSKQNKWSYNQRIWLRGASIGWIKGYCDIKDKYAVERMVNGKLVVRLYMSENILEYEPWDEEKKKQHKKHVEYIKRQKYIEDNLDVTV
ncbi:hypothetical protein G9G63_09565 [Paenibacillus sp. EKM202P]|uniref:hypothetical protein n=1 Tax=unclassified Paenibacillus TaxID=185978 RepID=UPI0013EA7764|nr:MULTISPECIES: hypothetical protein [unclassified Paenibacillus]KAF6565395.1 hypothetical protein G9G63_09565 [Paenibacillus sp. EKM202P]KAF6569280.1 hypothetical protein G9G64_12530 [Paenibacillus sp. EKM207P]